MIDRALVSALRQDSRSSATALAVQLNVSRATIHSRIERLIQNKVISKFTIELGPTATPRSVKAVMLISLKGNLARRVIKALKKLPEITGLHTTNGSWDLVAQITAHDLPDFDRVLGNIREIDGVLNSDTSILLNQV
ncbi:MAG: Lrp/AsnC family transcriptional regulator [Pseudomonadota bacterium]